MDNGLSIKGGLLWAAVWLLFMLLYTFLDVAVWRKIAPDCAKYLNLFSILFCTVSFLLLLMKRGRFIPHIFQNTSLQSILLALGSAILFYLLLDKCLDPIFDSFFPQSKTHYQESLLTLSKAPIISLLHVCILAPALEEILMRGFLLGGLAVTYGNIAALLISTTVFALFHFNMVQTLSAFLCGLVLGLLYLKTGSLFCCIIAHMGYNLLSYITAIYPLYSAK